MKHDLFNDWNKGDLHLFRPNIPRLTLILKKADGVTIQKFRPIALKNYSFSFFQMCNQ
jgi:hypothetical protein